ncbi:multicopper oxidase family protein [Microbacterium sp. LTA6]|uniref:multicopper oxidase family protein n=1 Tax=Microbacterium sp. LTA6 TaxID=3129771 RepID=UPI00324859B3
MAETVMAAINRRAFIGGTIGGIVAAGLGVPIALSLQSAPTSTGNLLTSRIPLPEPFRRRLTVPPVLAPVRTDASTDHYLVRQQITRSEIIPGTMTELWTYGGSFPGPTIESRRGRSVIVTHVNELPVPTVVHLHGGRTPAKSDGYPIDFVLPSDMTYYNQQLAHRDHASAGHSAMTAGGDVSEGERTYVYPLEQRAATLWYHDHRMDFTGPSVWRGLAGFHLHRDDEEDALDLPRGARELPLMIVDRSFAADGSLLYPSSDPTLVHEPGVMGDYIAGVLGDVMLVNGMPWPEARVDGVHHRLRLLNASNARRLSLRLDPAPRGGIMQIGTDGGLLDAPLTHDHLVLAPAQRLDVVVDFGGYPPGTVVTLRNDYGNGRMGEVMRFVVGDAVEDSFTMPDRLSSVATAAETESIATRAFHFRAGDIGERHGWLIGGQPFGADEIAATVAAGSLEVWELFADFHHPVHLHGASFQVLQRGSEGPGAFDFGWKDTIDLQPGEQARIAVRFDTNPGKYVFHCHNLEHEDMAMMANILIR